MPPRPTLRESTSAPISKVIVSSSRHASSSRASSRRPYQRDSVAISGPPGGSAAPSVGLGAELLHLRTVLGPLTDDASPAGLAGLALLALPPCPAAAAPATARAAPLVRALPVVPAPHGTTL